MSHKDLEPSLLILLAHHMPVLFPEALPLSRREIGTSISITRNWIAPQNGGISSILHLISRNFHFPPPQMMPLQNQSKTYVISILSYCLIYKRVFPITKSRNGAREFSSQLLLGDKYPCRAQQVSAFHRHSFLRVH